MTDPLRRLGRGSLASLAEALAAGRLGPPYHPAALAHHVPDPLVQTAVAALAALDAEGMAPRHIARTLALLAEERAAGQRIADRLQLVLSPPELDQVDARDTIVVVQDLLRAATSRVIIASYALDEGPKAEALFGALAARMDQLPDLDVALYLNVHRPHLDDTPSPVLLGAFAKRFRERVWPGARLPRVYYDPRSLEQDPRHHAVLHAKCVVVDDRWTFLTSANFTQAAQERNIEAGVLLEDPRFAERLRRQFEGLVERGVVREVLGVAEGRA
ncbi:MAG: DISARM system phospholipase D-like protein DrmC [Pseudomonadota bacterium]